MHTSFRVDHGLRGVLTSVVGLLAIITVAQLEHSSSLFAQATMAARLEKVLEPLAKSHAGEVAASVRGLDSDNQIVFEWHYRGRQVMPTASLIKLPVMLEAYRQAEAKTISLDDILVLKAEDKVPGSGILTDHFSPGLALSLRDAIRLMIRYSDNTATNMVVDHIGIASTAKSMADYGWPETQLHSKVFRRDTSIAPGRSEQYGLGSTTAEDMTDLLVRLQRGELVSPAASTEMLGHLLVCDDDAKLPRDLPAGFKVAHKTGSVNRSRTAAGLIQGAGIQFAICVMTDKNEDTSWTKDNAGDKLIGTMARAVVDELVKELDPKVDSDRQSASNGPLKLEKGASGLLVETLQRTLNARIDAGLGVDGDFGSATEAAVKQFQVLKGIADSGAVDEATWKALGTLIEEEEPVGDPSEVNATRLPREAALDPSAPPAVTAAAWISVDMETGKVHGELAAHQPRPIASTTKVMTALLVLELSQANESVLDEIVTFSERADKTLGSTAGIRAGERLPVRELLYGLLLPSGNDASVALAEHFGDRLSKPDSPSSGADDAAGAYGRFVQAMNRRAAELGMTESHFSNPHGLPDAEHLSSAADLATLTRAAWKIPLMREIVQTRVRGAQVNGSEGYTRNLRWENTNRLLQQEGFCGLKTGTTDAAGACLIAVGAQSNNSDHAVVVVLGSSSSESRYIDARNLFAWTWRSEKR